MALVTARTFANSNVRPPAVAGTFYPGERAELEASVRQYLERAKTEIGVTDGPAPKAIIAPHAGYVYSGLTAAAAAEQFIELNSVEQVNYRGDTVNNDDAVTVLGTAGGDGTDPPRG